MPRPVARGRARRERRHRRLQGGCELLRLLTESGHDVRVVPTRSALRLRRRAHLGRAVRQPGDRRGLGRRPRGAARADRPGRRPRRGRTGHRRPARQGRPRPGRRPAHQHAADRALPGPVGPGDAHRDVAAPRHRRTTSRRCAAAASSSSTRRRAGSPVPTPGPAGCPSRPRSSRLPRVLARRWPAAASGHRARPGRPARRGLAPAAPASTSTRCASSATGPPAGRATPWPRPPWPAAPRSRWSRPTSPCPTRPAPRSSGRLGGRPAGGRPRRRRRRRRGRDGRGGRRLPARATQSSTKIKKGPAEPEPVSLSAQPRHPGRAGRAGPRPGDGQVMVGFAAETGDAEGDVLTHGRAKLARKGVRPAGRQRGRSAGHRRVRGAPTTPR